MNDIIRESFTDTPDGKKAQRTALDGFEGKVATPGDLPLTGNEVGDVYLVESPVGMYQWNGSSWQPFSGGTGGGHTIQDEGISLTQRSKLNFVGDGVIVTDDAGNDTTKVTIPTTDISGLVVKNSPITGATKTKITYDAKGLVTDGADATTADISDSLDKRYVTDAEKVSLPKIEGVILNNTDANTVTSGGRYGMIGTPTNGAISGEFALDVTTDGTRVMQIATYLTGVVYTRYYTGSSWNSWVKYSDDAKANLSGATFTGDISATNLSGTNTGDNAVNSLYSGLATSKQDTLISGTNIKTINSTSLLGSGDIVINGGLVGTKEVDETNIADGKTLIYKTASGKYELETPSAGGSGGNIVFQDYGGQNTIGILGIWDATTSGTLVEATLICDTLPTGSNFISELLVNGTNVLNSTLQVTTTESYINQKYTGTPVTSFTNASFADGATITAYITSVGSTNPGTVTNARLVLRYS